MRSRTALFSLIVSPIILAAGPLLAQQKITVECSAVLRWSEIVRNDERGGGGLQEPHAIHPPQYWYPRGSDHETGDGVATLSNGWVPIQSQPTDAMAAIVDFEAIPDNNGPYPPDTQGAAGPSHLMTMLNTEVRIQDKSGAIVGTVSLSSFWSVLNGGPFDPRLHYDAIHGRWLASCSSTNRVFFAISSSSNPTDSWSFYEFVADPTGTTWADFPRLGFNTNWIVLIATMAGSPLPPGQKMWVIDKATALAGGPLTVTIFSPHVTFQGQTYYPLVIPCVTYGSEPTLYLISLFGERPDSVQLAYLSQITGTGSAPAWSVVPGSDSVGTGSFPTGARFEMAMIAATQLGTSTVKIETGGGMQSAVYRNGRIWFTLGAALPDSGYEFWNRMAIFWFEVDPQAMPRPVIQSGVFDGGPGAFYFYSSIAVNSENDACIGFSYSDASMYIEAAYSGRLSTHPPGTMIPLQILKPGGGMYWKSWPSTWLCRWGDYSNTCVDPEDDITFWTIQEYAGTPVGSGNGSGRWGTRWGKIQPATALPIQLSSFSAVVLGGGHVRLDWTTLSELNNFGFEVQKSPATPGNYQTILNSFVPGHGTTNEPQYYSQVDTTASPGRWYYRLKQIDLDGPVHYTHGIQVDVLTGVAGSTLVKEFALCQNYPNPFNPSSTIDFVVPHSAFATLKLYSLVGEEVMTLVSQPMHFGKHSVRVDGGNLSSGVYIYRLQAGDFVQTRKLMLLR